MQGWIRLHRELLEKPIWKCSKPEQKAILVTLLLMANHDEKEWVWQGKRFKCAPGQFVTSLTSIANESGTTIQNVRTALKNFSEIHDFLTDKPTKTGRLVTIKNWALYQSCELEPTIKTTKHQQSINKEVTTNKNDKNDKNNIYVDFFEQIWQLYPKKEGKGQVSLAQKKKLYSIGLEEMTRAIDRYKKDKQGTDRKYLKNGSTFFNSGYIDYLDANYQEDKPESLYQEI
jgi:hypothetical protein